MIGARNLEFISDGEVQGKVNRNSLGFRLEMPNLCNIFFVLLNIFCGFW
jgi:hypothetical protein